MLDTKALQRTVVPERTGTSLLIKDIVTWSELNVVAINAFSPSVVLRYLEASMVFQYPEDVVVQPRPLLRTPRSKEPSYTALAGVETQVAVGGVGGTSTVEVSASVLEGVG
jgi:hypothetical protein